MSSNISDRAFQAALDAFHERACDDEVTQLKAGIKAYLEVIHVHVLDETPQDQYSFTKEEADELFKPRHFEV